jgi:cytochrome b pre-mRNA-processing protein 6
MIKQKIAQHYTALLALWPKDPLRPTVSFRKVLEHRASLAKAGTANEKAELGQINAAYSLLDNRYSKRVWITFL